MRCRKVTLQKILMVQDGTRNTRRKQKKRIIKEINWVVDWLRQVAIKAQSFIQYYVLHKLSNGQDLNSKTFTPNSIYGFMQLIVCLPITNTDPTLPQDHQEIFRNYQSMFDDGMKCMVPNLLGYSTCFSYMKDTIATANLNAITESLRLCAETYIAFLLRDQIPHEVKKKKKIHVYIKYLPKWKNSIGLVLG